MNNLAVSIVLINVHLLVKHNKIVQMFLLNASQNVVVILLLNLKTGSFVKMLMIVKKLKDTDLVISN